MIDWCCIVHRYRNNSVLQNFIQVVFESLCKWRCCVENAYHVGYGIPHTPKCAFFVFANYYSPHYHKTFCYKVFCHPRNLPSKYHFCSTHSSRDISSILPIAPPPFFSVFIKMNRSESRTIPRDIRTSTSTNIYLKCCNQPTNLVTLTLVAIDSAMWRSTR